VLVSTAKGYYQVLLLYFATGLGSGAANVPLMALSATWFSRTKRGRATGFIVIGSGFGMILSGKLIPAVNAAVGPSGWGVNWLILGIASSVIAVICLALIRDRPEELGLNPVGADGATPRDFSNAPAIYANPIVYHLGGIYFLFGITYVIYATFIVTALVADHGFTEAGAGTLYAWVGVLSLLSGPVFGTLSDRLGRKAAFLMVFGFQALAYFFVAPWLPSPFVYLSIVLFGLVAWSIPSIMAAAIGDYLGAARAAQAFGFVTFIFAFGQIAGPAAAGVLAESSGSFAGSFYLASGLAVAAAVVSAFLKKPSLG
jgi:MFS family permease